MLQLCTKVLQLAYCNEVTLLTACGGENIINVAFLVTKIIFCLFVLVQRGQMPIQ